MRISFITTVFNEEKSIEYFMQSVFKQTRKPDEIIVTDGGSRDKTVELLQRFGKKIVILQKKGNRAIGRNEAIKKATGDIILCSDAGNILDSNWIKHIVEPFNKKSVDVVAGYYQGVAKTFFQKSIIPYALVMPDKVDPNNFLPATRSVAFRKAIWKRIGGFDEKLSHNEDYAFAKALQKAKVKIVFKRDAIVYWMPRNSFREAFIMMYRFAYGDAEARIFRPKVILVFLRYLLGFLLLIAALMLQSVVLILFLVLFFVLYVFWAIAKNYKYVRQWQAFYLLPLLQFIADWAVLKGTLLGLIGQKISYN